MSPCTPSAVESLPPWVSTMTASATGVRATATRNQPSASPSGLPFAADDTPAPLRRAFAAVHDAFPDADGTRAEVAWSVLHGLATLQAGGRLRAGEAQARLDLAHRMLTDGGTR